VVVGAGASGLAAAKWYQDRFGADAKILLIDPLPDFGGHSHRNEFHIPDATAGGADVMLLRNGGTVNLDSVGAWNQPQGGVPPSIPASYGQPAVDMLAFCGVDAHSFPNTRGPGIPSDLGLGQVLLFPAADWGKDTVVRAKTPSQSWPDFLAGTPYSATHRPASRRS
jgi:spermidine dehydrogenase